MLILQSNKKTCYDCKTNTTLLKDEKYERWYKHRDLPNEILCHFCYSKYYRNPKTVKKDNIKNNQRLNKRRFLFKKRRILLDYELRKGYCSKCPNNIYNKSCKTTHLHHSKGYYIIIPYYGLIELCPSCHRKERK